MNKNTKVELLGFFIILTGLMMIVLLVKGLWNHNWTQVAVSTSTMTTFIITVLICRLMHR